MTMTESAYKENIEKVKAISMKLKTITELTNDEKSMIRAALVDQFIDKIECETTEDVPTNKG